jgi:hypothetical protein
MTFKNSMASIVNDDDTSTPVVEEVEPPPEPEVEPVPLKVTGRKPVPKKKSTTNA